MKKFLAKYRVAAIAVLVAALTLWLAHLGWANEDNPVNAKWGVFAALVPAGMSLYRYLVEGDRKMTLAVRLTAGTSLAALMLLATNLWVAIGLAAILAGLTLAFDYPKLPPILHVAAAGVLQFCAIWAIFLAGAVWQWPMIVLLGLTWASSTIAGYYSISYYTERAARLLAATWGLIASQCAYIFSIWLVNYVVGSGWIIVPQAALVITALGYVFGSIYFAHKKSQLGLWRLVEYLLIGLLLILIVAVGTKWTGSF